MTNLKRLTDQFDSKAKEINELISSFEQKITSSAERLTADVD